MSTTATSTHTSPASDNQAMNMPYHLSRDQFSIEMPSPRLNAVNVNSALQTPNSLASPSDRRAQSFTRDGILGSAMKARNMSQSSADRHATGLSNGNTNGNSNGSNSNGKDSGDDGINPLKRRNTDAGNDYPRRRATIACEICRSRKSRCDGNKPKCRLCVELGAECIYREPGIKLDAGDKLILERLSRIEVLLQSNQANQNAATAMMMSGVNGASLHDASPANSHASVAISNEDIMASHVNFMSMIPVTGLGTWQSQQPTNISTMPKEHTNAALHLLQWPIIRDLVSRPYDPQILLQLEMSREALTLPKDLRLDLSNTSPYIRAFFSRVNVWYAVVNPFDWPRHYRSALSNGFREGPESCIVLLVLALGQASMHGSISRVAMGEDPPGLSYFAAAWALLPALMTRNTVISAQCMVLAAAYLFYLVRPLEAWTLLSSTSTKLQLLLAGPGRVPPEERELSERVYWNALLFESDLLAELDLPHSGIVQFEECVGLPCGFQEYSAFEHLDSPSSTDINSQVVGRDELWYFLAEIALRRLLNRVSQLIYSKDSVATMSALEPVVAELDFQLGQWYESLPLALQFPYTRGLLSDPVQTVLRLRFYACRTIIFRPYILAVMDNPEAALDPGVRENCRKCLDAAIRQLENIEAHHAGHMPYLWQGALSIVSQTLLVMGATMSPALAPLLPPPHEMDNIINGVVEEIALYSRLAPSLALSAEIIREAELRRQDVLMGMGMR